MVEIKQIEREDSKIKFRAIFSQSEVQKAYQKTISSLSKDIKVPGFRKGKVPPNIIKMYLGKERLAQEVVDSIFPQAYKQAKEELAFEPVGYPELLDLSFEEDKDSFFDVEVDIQPEIKLPDLSEIEVERVKVRVEDNEIEDAIEELRNSMAYMEPVDYEEIKGEKEEVAILKLDIDPHDKEINKKYKELLHKEEIPVYFKMENPEGLDKEIIDNLMGKKVGDQINFSYRFPEDFYIKELAGKEVEVTIEIKDLKRIMIPNKDDELAKELGYDDFSKLREDVYNRLLKEKQEREEIRFENEIIKKLLDGVEFDPPRTYVERRMKSLKEDFLEDLKRQNLTLEEYLKSHNLSENDLDAFYREEALSQVKISMLLDKIEEEYSIKIEKDDVEKELENFATSYGINMEKAKESYEKSKDIKSYIDYKAKRNKVMEFLKNNIKVKEVENIEKKEESESVNDENR